MENVFQLFRNTTTLGKLTLHPDSAGFLGITRATSRTIKFGSQTFLAKVTLSSEIPIYEASLSADIMDKLAIPADCCLEIKKNGRQIIIGPFIGILAGVDEIPLKKELPSLMDYLFHYRQIRGAIIAFSLDQVNQVTQMINGFIFNPGSKQWEAGIFPYPASLFIKTTGVNSTWIEHFQSVIGNKIFNDFDFDKWRIHRRFATSVEVKNYMPESTLYNSPRDLYYFLKTYPNVNIKSIHYDGHLPIKVILKDRNNIVFQNPSKNEFNTFKFSTRDQAYSIFSRYFTPEDFIIQEAIDVTGYKTMTVRVIMLKNQDNQWQEMGMFTEDTTIPGPNFPYVLFDKKRLRDFLNMSDLHVLILYNEFINIATDAMKNLETSGKHHVASGVVEMIIGELGDIWITDIKTSKPYHEMALVAGYPELYFEILKTNMMYAKSLSGF